jgi:limonene-1,2-epoxide hydrolase
MTDLRERREAIVREHMATEVAKDFDATVRTFARPRYEVIATGETHEGASSVHSFLSETGEAFPDFRFETHAIRHADDALLVEVDFMGNVSLFEDEGLVAERLYFDLLTVLRQLGIARDPTSLSGRLQTLVAHPITVGGALVRGLRASRR